ncbi:hypothetical protein ABZ078_09440 [Streptomyces sp. NPDC006385]
MPCRVVPYGMVEFLRKLLARELAPTMDFAPGPRFVHRHER